MSIYWVKETVNADAIGTINTYADPYGIQKAFDTATAGDEIRIVTGSNNYNSASTSWTNRDDSTFTINVDTNQGTITSLIAVSGWTDETTEGTVTLDFEKASITGSNGFTVGAFDYYSWKNIRVTACDLDGWDFAAGGIGHAMYKCRADNCGGSGVDGASSAFASPVSCQFDNNGVDGFQGPVGAIVLCEAHDNTADGFGGAPDLTVFVLCVSDGNGDDGFAVDDNCTLVNCTAEDNTGDGLGNIASSAIGTIVVNSAFTNNDAYGIGGSGGLVLMEINCGFYLNGTAAIQPSVGISAGQVTTDPQYVAVGSRNYALGENWKALGEGGFLSGSSVGYVDIGAVQRQEAAGALSFIQTRRNTLIGR